MDLPGTPPDHLGVIGLAALKKRYSVWGDVVSDRSSGSCSAPGLRPALLVGITVTG